ncbi:MAG: hypothetical protein DI604_25040 [Delftia acidovorans]|nr:MAG: hypothetical protein DI604_25040 [Delftia acidovorans]
MFGSVESGPSETFEDSDMKNEIILVGQISEFDGEPRIRDLELGELLNFDRPRKIRDIIDRNAAELLGYGRLPQRGANLSSRGGRPSKAYYLNEGQALVICALSRTDKAAQIRKAIIEVFMAYRQGKLVDVQAHYRKPPAPEPQQPKIRSHMRSYPQFDGSVAFDIQVPWHRAKIIAMAYAEATS